MSAGSRKAAVNDRRAPYESGTGRAAISESWERAARSCAQGAFDSATVLGAVSPLPGFQTHASAPIPSRINRLAACRAQCARPIVRCARIFFLPVAQKCITPLDKTHAVMLAYERYERRAEEASNQQSASGKSGAPNGQRRKWSKNGTQHSAVSMS